MTPRERQRDGSPRGQVFPGPQESQGSRVSEVPGVQSRVKCQESQGSRATEACPSLTSTPNSHDLCSAVSWHLVTAAGGRARCPLRACVSPTRPGVAGLNPGGCGWGGDVFVRHSCHVCLLPVLPAKLLGLLSGGSDS